MRRFAALCAAVVLCCSVLTSCAEPAPVTRSGVALNTAVSVSVYGESRAKAEAALDACFAELARLEGLLSATMETSDIAAVNTASGTAVTVSSETADLLRQALYYAELTDGAFDVTVRPLTELWNFSAASPCVPTASAVAAAVATVDYHHLTVDGTTVTLTAGGVEPGGIAKGYIADRLRQVLSAQGITSALIDLGGNIVACGSKNGGEWRIGVKDPDDETGLCAIITGRDTAVVTSGIYERGFTQDGVRYHHLLDTKTGYPVQNGLSSVTVVCASSTAADALSTACFVMGEERATALLSTLPGTEALFVRTDGTLRATAGLSYTLP